MKILAQLVVLLWALSIFIRGLVAQLAPARARPAVRWPAKPTGLEWRKIGRLPAGRIVALRVQVIVC